MFTNSLKLPIESDRLARSDRTLSLSDMTWTDYERFDAEEYYGYLISYFQGVITIVSPGRNHENISQTFIVLINAYCRHYGLIYYPMGSTRLQNPPLAGKEPDISYAFVTNKNIPDLAIEVVFSGETPRRRKTQGNAHQESSGGVIDLEKYKLLGVKEVWFWQNNTITFFQLIDNEYREIAVSGCLSQITQQFLASFINRGLSESPLTIEADFISNLP